MCILVHCFHLQLLKSYLDDFGHTQLGMSRSAGAKNLLQSPSVESIQFMSTEGLLVRCKKLSW